MKIFDQLKNEIDRGRAGLNTGFDMGLPKLESVIDGVTQSTYTLIISSSGSGKTSFSLYAYVYKPLMQHLDDDNFRVLYVSLEIIQYNIFYKYLYVR